MKMKKKRSAEAEQNGSVRHFWIYALILFSCAIALMMAGQALQSKELEKAKTDLEFREHEGAEKQSALQTVQDLNKSLSEKVSRLTEELEEAKGFVTSAQYDIDRMEEEKELLKIMIEAQTLYMSGKYKAGREKLAEIDEESLPEELAETYQTVKKKLK